MNIWIDKKSMAVVLGITLFVQPVVAADALSEAQTSPETRNQVEVKNSNQDQFVLPSMTQETPLLRQQFAPWRSRSDQGTTLLQGQISTGRSPILPDVVEEVPKDAKIQLIVPDNIHINSEVSQKGDEVLVRIGKDITSGGKVVLPGGWYARGLVSDVQSIKRHGRDGYVEVRFDKLVSPDGAYEVPFDATFSTKDNRIKAVTRMVLRDTGYMAVGSAAGAVLSVQLTGIGTAIATHGISVGVGAGVGATIGLIGALKNKGKIRAFNGGDEMTLVTEEPITLPGFDQELLPSAKPVPHLEGLDLTVKNYHFAKPYWGDKSSRLLELDLDVINRSEKNFHFYDLKVMSDRDVVYDVYPAVGTPRTKVAPGGTGQGKLAFLVDSPKRKYFLIFLSRRTGKELSRVAIN